MPKVAAEMSALEVRNLANPSGKGNALFAVGGVSGLYIQITPSGGRSWILRTTVGKARRDIGLGGFPTVTLSQARDKAREAQEAGADFVGNEFIQKIKDGWLDFDVLIATPEANIGILCGTSYEGMIRIQEIGREHV